MHTLNANTVALHVRHLNSTCSRNLQGLITKTTSKCVLRRLFLHFQQNRQEIWSVLYFTQMTSIWGYTAPFVTSCNKTPLHNFKTNHTECWWCACLNLSMLCEKLHAKEFSFHLIQLQGMQTIPYWQCNPSFPGQKGRTIGEDHSHGYKKNPESNGHAHLHDIRTSSCVYSYRICPNFTFKHETWQLFVHNVK